jgi:hypothetical protein
MLSRSRLLLTDGQMMNDETEKWRVQIRRDLLEQIAAGLAHDGGTKHCFLQSREFKEYKEAFKSWEEAIWNWVDSELTPDLEIAWRQKLLDRKDGFSPASDYSKPAGAWDMENYLQSYLLRRSVFLNGLRHKKDGDASWFKGFAFYYYHASQLDDDLVFEELARLTKRKTSQKQLGKRSLHFWLLVSWIPACFWAITNDGMIARLVLADSEKRYNERSIRNEISKLKLRRPTKPLYWGIDKKNGCWIPLH